MLNCLFRSMDRVDALMQTRSIADRQILQDGYINENAPVFASTANDFNDYA